MKTPDDMDALLASLMHENLAQRIVISDDDRAFVEKIMDSVTTGSRGCLRGITPQ